VLRDLFGKQNWQKNKIMTFWTLFGNTFENFLKDEKANLFEKFLIKLITK